jgi:hypothetical protein
LEIEKLFSTMEDSVLIQLLTCFAAMEDSSPLSEVVILGELSFKLVGNIHDT